MKVKEMFRGKGRPEAYKNAAGERLPSVTTITGARKTGVEGLLVWANRLGLEGKSHKEERQKAADAGSLAHSMVENTIHGKEHTDGLPEMEMEAFTKAEQGWRAWQDWSRVMQVDYIATETPLISELHQYGGTPDAIGIVDSRVALIDWKTSNRVYGDYIIQMAAYRQLWNESGQKPIESCYLLRFGKEMGDYHVHAYPDAVLELGWRAFLHLREMYQLDKELGKVAS